MKQRRVVMRMIVSSLLMMSLFVGSKAYANNEDELQWLLEKEQVIETVTRLFIHTDRLEWDQVKAVFAPNVLFDMTSMAGGEPVTLSSQQIVDSWDTGLKPLKAVHHQIDNFLVTIKGQEAEVFCYGMASLTIYRIRRIKIPACLWEVIMSIS